MFSFLLILFSLVNEVGTWLRCIPGISGGGSAFEEFYVGWGSYVDSHSSKDWNSSEGNEEPRTIKRIIPKYSCTKEAKKVACHRPQKINISHVFRSFELDIEKLERDKQMN